MNEQKRAIRQEIRRREQNLSVRYKQDASRRIANFICNSRIYQKARVISCFVGTRREIDTRPILNRVLENPDKRLCVPLCINHQNQSGVMEMREIFNFNQLSPGVMGILEPDCNQTNAIPPDQIDFIILPCLSCDIKTGRRLGYGGGYYDKYLNNLNNLNKFHGEFILLCREKLLSQEIPLEFHDILIPRILTERGFYIL